MTTATSRDEAPLSPGRFYAVMAVLMLVEILSSLEHSMVITALPVVVREFGDIRSAGWIVTAFLLAQAATAAVGGRLGDMFGRRRVLFVIMGLCSFGSLVSALGTNLETVILGRAIQGASGAILPLCYGLTRQVAPAGKAPLWIGVLTGAYSAASAVGYIVGGHLADIGSWRSVFWLTAIYSSALILPLLLVVPPLRGARTSSRFDVLGAVLFAPAVAAILYGLTQAQKSGWATPATGGLVAFGFALAAVWFWHEWRRRDPLIDVRLLGRREIWLGNICGGLASFGMMQLPVVMLLLMQQPRMAGVGLAVSGAMAGLLKLPSNLAALGAAPFSGWISGRRGSRMAMIVGSSVAASAWTFLYFFHDTLPQVVAGTIMCAFGSSMLLAAIPNLVLEAAPMDRSSEVTGLTSVVRSMFSAVGAQSIAILLASSQVLDPKSGAKFPSEQAYELVFVTVAGTSALIALLCIVVKTRRAGATGPTDAVAAPVREESQAA